MSTLVIDASVAAKWFLPSAHETNVEMADALLRRYAAGKIRFVVPDLFWAELGNIFWKAVRLGRWKRADAENSLLLAQSRPFPTIPSKELLQDALGVSLTFDRSVYDGLYVALAMASKGVLVTADERLANALAAHLPVRWLGTFN